jgi:hypothetical protein
MRRERHQRLGLMADTVDDRTRRLAALMAVIR